MLLTFKTNKLRKECSSEQEMRRKYGDKLARKLMQRLMELRAADCLAIISNLPPARCHELKGNYKGHFSVDLEQPMRLIFRPVNEPLPVTPDGSIDKGLVTEIEVVAIEDTH
jgi:plasmid maintenance system killer protein